MSLSDKRAMLEKAVLNGELDIRRVFISIEQQDKDFIKELNDSFELNREYKGCFIKGMINKIFGDKLIK